MLSAIPTFMAVLLEDFRHDPLKPRPRQPARGGATTAGLIPRLPLTLSLSP
jgi:hypothetical protein